MLYVPLAFFHFCSVARPAPFLQAPAEWRQSIFKTNAVFFHRWPARRVTAEVLWPSWGRSVCEAEVIGQPLPVLLPILSRKLKFLWLALGKKTTAVKQWDEETMHILHWLPIANVYKLNIVKILYRVDFGCWASGHVNWGSLQITLGVLSMGEPWAGRIGLL